VANLAAGLRNIVYPIVPQQIVIGGSVADQPEAVSACSRHPYRCAGHARVYPNMPPMTSSSRRLGSLASPLECSSSPTVASQPFPS
jgi:hypothetical protein